MCNVGSLYLIHLFWLGPVGAPQLPVLTTRDPRIIERWLEDHVGSNGSDEYSILGFDTESIAKVSIHYLQVTAWIKIISMCQIESIGLKCAPPFKGTVDARAFVSP